MKVIAVNGSPRKNWNTGTLLQKALDGAKSVGADTEIVHLYDLNFKGCVSCFACKRKDCRRVGHCAMRDDLSSVLERISECDVLFLGSPIYFGNVTGEMRSFWERLIFPKITYNIGHGSVFTGKISSCFIYTMNVPKDIRKMNIPEELMKHMDYENVYNYYKERIQVLNGTSEYMTSCDTYQFDDYSKYEASMFDEQHKSEVKAVQFPQDCQKAFEIGVRLALSAGDKD
jgi:multimeric flavodoxin WrbA